MSKTETLKPGSQQREVVCPRCGKNDWKWIKDSLAQYCQCGFVRVMEDDGSFTAGASLQEWAADLAMADTSQVSERVESELQSSSLDALVRALERWREVAKQPRRERRLSAPRPAYYVIIDEPGMGYCSPAWSCEDAMRQANKLRSDGYRVIVKRPND